jgi:hypothetical protein
MILGKLALGAAGTVVLAGAWMVSEGLVRVSVYEMPDARQPKHVNVIVPAALVPAVLHFVPDSALHGALEQARPWMPAAQAACEGLAKLPDTQLVEIRNSHEHVRIGTHDGRLVIDVENTRETVHVSFPLRTAWRVAREIQERGPSS